MICQKKLDNAYRQVNFIMVEAYWSIGQQIVEEEQNGKDRAEYGSYLIKELSTKLTKDFGKGFTTTNLKMMRQFYLAFPNSHTLCSELSWSHVVELLKISDDAEREFYEKQTILESWSIRELQKALFEEDKKFVAAQVEKIKNGSAKFHSLEETLPRLDAAIKAINTWH
ncbi:MAG: DUF1016 N-terminal domain-containing protein [Sulfurimonadaceae bacterium]|jgi:hypothetical protein